MRNSISVRRQAPMLSSRTTSRLWVSPVGMPMQPIYTASPWLSSAPASEAKSTSSAAYDWYWQHSVARNRRLVAWRL